MIVKRWFGVGLIAAAAVSVACSPAATPDAPVAKATGPAGAAGEGGEGGGEGGESGEGGVNAAAAATDPVAYLVALAVVEAHVRAASGALAAGEKQAAAEMLAHPVSEVLVDMGPAFATLGVAPFDQQLLDASAAVFADETPAQITTRTDAILATLGAAAAKAPATAAGAAPPTAAVLADLIDRAANQYMTARGAPGLEPYLDGYGFKETARALLAASAGELSGLSAEARGALDQAMTALDAAYPTATRPATLPGDAGALLAASSRFRLAL